jgi:hypothetical protein
MSFLCAGCRERKARFRYRGQVRADRDHTLCFECYRNEINRARARRLAADAVKNDQSATFVGAAPANSLDRRQVQHRQLMLKHLRRVSRAS